MRGNRGKREIGKQNEGSGQNRGSENKRPSGEGKKKTGRTAGVEES